MVDINKDHRNAEDVTKEQHPAEVECKIEIGASGDLRSADIQAFLRQSFVYSQVFTKFDYIMERINQIKEFWYPDPNVVICSSYVKLWKFKTLRSSDLAPTE